MELRPTTPLPFARWKKCIMNTRNVHLIEEPKEGYRYNKMAEKRVRQTRGDG
jgi:hypothetical protein